MLLLRTKKKEIMYDGLEDVATHMKASKDVAGQETARPCHKAPSHPRNRHCRYQYWQSIMMRAVKNEPCSVVALPANPIQEGASSADRQTVLPHMPAHDCDFHSIASWFGRKRGVHEKKTKIKSPQNEG